nr:dephospho-CoA kinase [Allomuricauda sp.]
MKIVGLTGGIGSGKSTVAQMFRDLGVAVYDSDREAKNLMVDSAEVRTSIIELLGEDSYTDGLLNRSYIASRVFVDKGLLNALNNIVHPAVRKHFKNWAGEQDGSYVVQETALIFENGMADQFDAIILVTAPKDVRLERVVLRDQVSKKEILDRMDNQMEDSEKVGKSHFTIVNLDLENTREQVSKLHRKLAEKAD